MKRFTIFALSLSILTISCSKHDVYPIDKEENSLLVNNNKIDLQSRIEYLNQAVEFTKSANTLSYTLVASIKSKTINNQSLSASAVFNKDAYTYVCFHTRGESIAGEVLTIDVSSPDSVKILQSISSDIYDFNDICLSRDQSKLWLCGDENIENMGQAFAIELAVDNNIPNENISWKKNFDAYSGNSINPTYSDTENNLWISSGSNGGLNVFNIDNLAEESFSFKADNTKHFTAGRDYGLALIGINDQLSILRVFDLKTSFEYTDYEIPYDVSNLGKNGIHIERKVAYLAMGDDGLIVFDLALGKIKSIFKIAGGGTANSVFTEKESVYIAYGSAGLIILNKPNMELLGQWKYEGSCNDVYVNHGTVYVANGSGEGFYILKEN